MTVIGIHQPHYFPWLGYLHKMACADRFVILDAVQLTDRSPMVRNRFLQNNGTEHYLSLSINKRGYRDRSNNEIELVGWSEVWAKHRRFLELNYRRTPGFSDVWSMMDLMPEAENAKVIDVDMASIAILRAIYDIDTPLIMQSTLAFDSAHQNCDLLIDILSDLHADCYLSGNGARNYMVDEKFTERGISVSYQDFSHPVYPQFNSKFGFFSGMSALDMVFHRGVEEARRLFWESVSSSSSFAGNCAERAVELGGAE